MRLVLFEPDIPQNTGAILRLAACLGLAVDIVEPCGFVLDDRRLKRVAMDYGGQVALTRHRSWDAFRAWQRERPGRLVLVTRHGEIDYHEFAFRPEDCLVLGRESAGAPPAVHDAAAARVRLPIAPGARAFNVVAAAAIVAAEALRQTGGLPGREGEDRTEVA